MEIIYVSRKKEEECIDMKSISKKFGGDMIIIQNLQSKIKNSYLHSVDKKKMTI